MSLLSLLGACAAQAQAPETLYHAVFVIEFQGDENWAAPKDINDGGQVLGENELMDGGFLWDRVQGFTLLGGLAEYPYSIPGDMNNLAQITGICYGAGPGQPGRGFLWDPQRGMIAIEELPAWPIYGAPVAINDSGQIAGWQAGYNRSFLWDPVDGPIFLSPLGQGQETYAADINDAGQIAGDMGYGSVFLWSEQDGIVPVEDSSGQVTASQPFAINNLGQIVGTGFSSLGFAGFLWDRQGRHDCSRSTRGPRYHTV